MLPHITDHQRQALEDAFGGPVHVIDHTNSAQYVLIDADNFKQFVDMLFEHEPDTAHLLS
jgi:hypothetical protein